MPFQIVRNDIAKMKVDAIVNSANHELIIGKGVDGAIYSAAGRDKLLNARKSIGQINFGDSKITPAFDLNAKFIIHTVAPVWHNGNSGEIVTLRKCYKNSLELALKNSCESAAFPLLATGVNNFPHDVALKVAIEEIQKFLFDHDMEISLVIFGKNILELARKILSGIEEHIDDAYVPSAEPTEYMGGLKIARQKQKSKSPKTFVKNFRDSLFELIDQRNLNDPDVYKPANVSSKVFSDIRTRANYQPSKKTAIALAISLKLSLQEIQDLLATTGYTLSDTFEFDRVIMDCIRRDIYDIGKIDEKLYAKGMKTFSPHD